MFQRLRACSLPFQLRKGPTLWHFPSVKKKKKNKSKTRFSPPIFLSVRVRVYVCGRFRRICNILFCIENDLGAILRCPYPLNRTLSSLPCFAGSHSCNQESCRIALGLPSSSTRSWQAATGEDDLSLYFLGRPSSSNKGISFFSFSFLSTASPPSFLSPFLTPILRHLHPSGVASCSFCLFLSPYSSSTTVHLRPLATTLPVHVVFHERAEILSLSLLPSLASLHLAVSSFLCHWLSPSPLSTPVTLPSSHAFRLINARDLWSFSAAVSVLWRGSNAAAPHIH